MNRVALTITLVLLATPAFSQEIDLGLGGDVGGLLNLPAPTGNRGAPERVAPPAGRGAASDARGAPAGPPVDRLVRLRELLAAAGAPFSKEL